MVRFGGNQESSSFKDPEKLYHVFLNFGPQDADSALNSREGKYDVFLSFRGDTRKGFTDFVYRSLVKEGIVTFRDTEELEPGEEIRSELTKAIRNSRLSVIVFSAGYAVSKWCLNELLLILEQKRYSRYQVVPVFYDVTPAEVRKQNGCFQEAFDYYEGKIKADTRNVEWKNKVSAWRLALAEVSHLSGKVLMNECNGYEGEFAEKIVGIVQKKLCRKNVDLRLNYGLSMNVKDTCMPLKYKLHKAFNEAGFLVFRDDNDLEDEENIISELVNAIEKSWLSIVVFSKNYMYSECCLDELVRICECHKNSGHIVFPVFYDVQPSEVRNQTRSVGEAFVRYEEKSRNGWWKQKVNGWRDALREISNLSGFSFQDFDDRNISILIQKIIAVTRDRLHIAALGNNYTVGLHSRAKSINLWLHDESSTIQILVVCGVSGIGKSAIAKFVYDSNHHLFESSIFLADIREVVSKNSNGLHTLQNQILSSFSNGTENEAFDHVNGNITRKIKDAICGKRTFIVLDDVSDVKQFDKLLGTRSFFPGSKIIVTMTSSQMLSLRANEVYKVYMVEPLDDEESLELFSWYAFGQDHPKQVYIEQSVRAAKQCRGIPKAVKFLGCLLFGRVDHNKWEDELETYGAESETAFVEQLQLSYDSLQDEHDKVLFQHIACFFVGEEKDFTIEILNKCGFFTSIGIQNLVDRGLLIIDENKLTMREGFQQMGRDMVRRKSPEDPGKRTLLWHNKTSFDVVKKMMGTNMIKGLALDMHMFNEEKLRRPSTDVELEEFLDNTLLSNRVVSESRITSERSYSEIFINWLRSKVSKEVKGGLELSISALSRMENLELLKLNYVHLAGDYSNFPKNLRWLSWVGFPLKVIPSNLPLSNLVALDMRSSKLEKVWEKHKCLPSLKFMDLSHSRALASTPDFSGLPNLERLYLKGCVSLVVVSDSICELDGLEELDLEDCKSLKKLPSNFGSLKRSLQKLVLDGCSNLAEFGTDGGTWTRGNRLKRIEYYYP